MKSIFIGISSNSSEFLTHYSILSFAGVMVLSPQPNPGGISSLLANNFTLNVRRVEIHWKIIAMQAIYGLYLGDDRTTAYGRKIIGIEIGIEVEIVRER